MYEDPTLDELKVLAELDDTTDEDQILNQVRACGPLLHIYEDFEWRDLGSFRVTFILLRPCYGQHTDTFWIPSGYPLLQQ